MPKLIVDTDVGTDVDDLLVLAMLPAFPELEVIAVTTVHGDTLLRARLATLAGRLSGLEVPVAMGRSETLSGKLVFWPGHEGEGVDGLHEIDVEPVDAVEFLVESAAAEPGEIDVLAIGPLTNIAAALQADPSFATNVRHLYVMGGEYVTGYREHNFETDAVAARIVMESDVRVTATGLDQTLRVSFGEAETRRFGAAGPMGALLEDQTRRFWQWLATFMPPDRRDRNSPHDPMALLTLVRPDLFEFTDVTLVVSDDRETAGQVTVGDPGDIPRHRVVSDIDKNGVAEAILGALDQLPRT